LKLLALIELFRRGDVSTGYAAEVLGMTRWEFITLLGDHGVPYVDMTAEELEADVEQARAAFQRQG
jgi:predicted HTH domain antitoxin